MTDKIEPLNMHGHANTWEEELQEVCAERDALRAENERLKVEAEQNAHWRYEAASRHTFEENLNMPDQCVVVIGQVERPWGEGSDRICGLWRRFHLTSNESERLRAEVLRAENERASAVFRPTSARR